MESGMVLSVIQYFCAFDISHDVHDKFKNEIEKTFWSIALRQSAKQLNHIFLQHVFDALSHR